jgi:hypothetical protein
MNLAVRGVLPHMHALLGLMADMELHFFLLGADYWVDCQR